MSKNNNGVSGIIIMILALIAFWAFIGYLILGAIAGHIKQAQAVEMTAKVEQSEMRTCIETCGYKFK